MDFGEKCYSQPWLRRVGPRVAFLDESSSFLFVAFSAAPDATQSAPRAELCAVIMLCRFVSARSAFHVYNDKKAVAEGIQQHRIRGDKEYLWIALWEIVADKGARNQHLMGSSTLCRGATLD